jgi:hypothetical protein
MVKAKVNKPLWKCDWSKLPENTIGACFNSDGIAWAWSSKPEIKGSEKRPNDLKWRGASYGEGYTMIGSVVARNFAKLHWKDSWLDKPKS